MHHPEAILLKFWGHTSFRKGQDAIVRSVLDGKDTLALLPTGGGKSVCFQVPAMCMDGVCIVVSPLLALMNDQIENLKRKGIAAVAVNSAMSKTEIDLALDQCIYGTNKFLYVSPERLRNELFLERIRKMKVNLLAVDEAHCISQWGYDFRPSYLTIADIRQLIPSVPVLALTASATPQVVADIQEKLEFKAGNVFRSSFRRDNLFYIARQEEDPERKVLEVCKSMRGSGIVYCNTRKKTKELAQWLRKHGITAGFYHAGMTHAERAEAYQKWFLNTDRVMCATNAFGMGIDKPDVRYVLHAHVPASLEAYFQEAGRGGRDGQTAYAGLFWNDKHLADLEEQIQQRYPDRMFIRTVYSKLCSAAGIAMGEGQDQLIQFDLMAWIKQSALPFAETTSAISLLERSEYLSVSDAQGYSSGLRIVADKEQVLTFLDKHEAFSQLFGGLIRVLPGVMQDFVSFREKDLANTLGLSEDILVSQLKDLERLGMIRYRQIVQLPVLTLLQPRVHESKLIIPESIYERRKKADLERAQSIARYLKNHECRSVQLLAYFGEMGAAACGHCDVCKANGEINHDAITKKMERHLNSNPLCTVESLASELEKSELKIALEIIRRKIDDGDWTQAVNGQIQIRKSPKQNL